ncbi:Xenotropic and polytropic retrovirus receptor 1 [Gnomoniopsis sp. IMI 355080]|nr:Xenotropic and polytropic retrovirus receptor 1 [Gnomoniopsis sp. IMI 355080]
MKFAKELERDLVPEWRIKYVDYKAGKKHIKAITKALSRAQGTPAQASRKVDTPTSNLATPPFVTPAPHPGGSQRGQSPATDDGDQLRSRFATMSRSPPRSIPISSRRHGEQQSLTDGADSDVQYGSIVPTPPDRGMSPLAQKTSQFELPGPAIKVPSHANTPEASGARPSTHRANSATSLGRAAMRRSATATGANIGSVASDPQEPGRMTLPPSGSPFPNLTPSDINSPRTRLRRMFTFTGSSAIERYNSRGDYDMRALDEVREKEREFNAFLDSQLDKVETFYKQKEGQAEKRLVVLREQLHEMRNRRTSEIVEARNRKRTAESNGHSMKETVNADGPTHIPLLDPLRAKLFRPGPNSKALSKMVTLEDRGGQDNDERRDYVRRPHEDEVPYRTAKRKLKLALQEFYRGLELLKSYALLNRTAFRKLNKKYDKAVKARPAYRYMTEKVNKSWFVNSDTLDHQLQAIEDLYARYFERGNHKVAAGKLRSLSKKKRDESGSAFQNGLFIGTGAVFAIQGLVYGAQLLFIDDEEIRTQTIYLMQIYGGYFLMLYLFSLFCLNCKIWTAARVNYSFVFEFDSRSQLDWRQLAEFPSFFLFLFGLFMWLNFSRYGSPAMYLYYPVILICVTFVILFLPAPILFHKSRRWFLYSHWRLFWAGLYPVEFRDFFLGDMYCSLTYAMCNIELFFCLYANSWENPQNCNSNHSRLLGFFATLPPVWRFLQCIRRYRDTKNVFPHLVNCGKYTASILSGVFLSVYRIENSRQNLGLFVAFSLVNGFYTAFWDIFMDFSLLQPHTSHRFLRDIIALKSRWPYYLIMVVDPMLRFNWVFYAIFTHDTQHSSIASFLIGFSEVTRRGLWTLLRVENEHCSNVKQYKASRDVPLPYHLELGVESDPLTSGRNSSESNEGGKQVERQDDALMQSPSAVRVSRMGAVMGRTQSGRSTGVDAAHSTPGASGAAEEGRTPGEESFRMRQRRDTLGKKTIRGILADAHKQDFEKKRKPESTRSGVGREPGEVPGGDDDDDDDEDEEDEDLDGEEARSLLNEREERVEAQMLSRAGKDEESE